MRPKKTILCVDDNEQILSVRKFLLETRGYKVFAAQSAQEALEIAETMAPGSLDLAVVDLLMPQMDGNEVIRRLKAMHAGLPTMLVSGTVTGHERSTAADVFLPKGASTPVEMLERIRVLVARRRGPKKQPARVTITELESVPSMAHTHATAPPTLVELLLGSAEKVA